MPTTNGTMTTETETRRKTLRYWSLGIVLTLLVVVVAVVVGVTWKIRKENNSSPTTCLAFLDDFACVQQELFDRSISNEAIFDTTSPQYKALEWLVYNDTSIDNVRSRPISIVIERYILAVLFFSTNGYGWKSNDGFLTPQHYCDWRFVSCSLNGYDIRKFLGI